MSKLRHWGVIGLSNTWMAFGDDGGSDSDRNELAATGYGIRRILDPGTLYREQPALDAAPRWIEKPDAKGRVYDMEWPGESPPETFSLTELQQRLADSRGKLTADSSDLASLDEGVKLLVEAVSRLHAGGASIGFFQPNSARFWHRHDGSLAIVLPDVGFAWDNAGGLLEPEWLTSPECELLFDEGPRVRNTSYREQLNRFGEHKEIRKRVQETSSFIAEDVRVLARFISLLLVGPDELRRWCGRSRALLKLPGKDRAADTEAPIWDQVIAPALEGQVATCKELQLRLAAAKPSEHFLFTPPKPPWRGWGVLRQTALVAVGLVVLFGLWKARDFIWPQVPPPPYCDRVPTGISLYNDLVRLEELQAAAATDENQYPVYFEKLLQCLHDHDSFEDCERGCLDRLVEAHAERLRTQSVSVLKRLENLPRPTAEECEALQAAVRDWDVMKTTVESYVDEGLVADQQIQGQLSRQLRLRGGETVAATAEQSNFPKQE